MCIRYIWSSIRMSFLDLALTGFVKDLDFLQPQDYTNEHHLWTVVIDVQQNFKLGFAR